jgi:prolipoprotein diacylglyceryltransferase
VNTLAQPTWWFLPDWVWAFDYPNTVVEYINPASGNHIVDIPDCSGYVTAAGERPHYCGKLAKAVFPTPIYETVLSLGIFGILWALRKRIATPGMIFFLYCVFNGFERFWIEKIRVNDKLDVLGIHATQAEIISTLLFFIGMIGCVYLWWNRRSPTVP